MLGTTVYRMLYFICADAQIIIFIVTLTVIILVVWTAFKSPQKKRQELLACLCSDC